MSTNTPTSSSPAASLAEVERVVGSWCDLTDPVLVSGADAAVAVERLAVVVRRLQAKQASFAARVEQCHSHSRRYGSSEEFLARVNGSSRSEAKRCLDTARRLQAAPGAAKEAFDRGDLSLGEAGVISAAVAVDPSAEATLVATATTSHDLAEVRERADRVKEAARHGEDPASRRSRLRAMRRWQEFDGDGMREVLAKFVKDDWIAVAPVVQAFLDAIYDQARREGRREPIEAYRADAVLAALAAAGHAVGIDPAASLRAAQPGAPTHAPATGIAGEPPAESDPTGISGGSGTAAAAESADVATDGIADTSIDVAALLAVRPERVKWNMVLLVDGIALQRGRAAASETCEIVGLGPVSVDLARQVLPDAVVDVLVHDLVDIRAHATMTRHQKQALKAALHARDRRCVVPGCPRRRWLQADHRHDFAKDGPTAYPNMEKLCEVHHREKTHRGARFERVDDEWHWYPPPPGPNEPEPSAGTIPWKAKVGEHLNGFDLTDLPPPEPAEPDLEPDATLPFG